MMRWLLAYAVLLCGCGEEGRYDDRFTVQTTSVYVLAGAHKFPDLPEWLYAAYLVTEQDVGRKAADELFEFDLYLWPDGTPIRLSDGSSYVGIRGLYWGGPGEIHIRTRNQYAKDSALPHELFEHRWPHFFSTDTNPNHLPEWEAFQLLMNDRVIELINSGKLLTKVD